MSIGAFFDRVDMEVVPCCGVVGAIASAPSSEWENGI